MADYYDKPFKDYDELIKIMESRNIIISDMIYSSMNMSCGCNYQTSDKICWMVISFNFFRYSNSAPCR